MSHTEEIGGFILKAHEPNARNISKKISEILVKKNEKIKVYLTPYSIKHFVESEFEMQCRAYFERYFETLAVEDPQIVPWKTPKESDRIISTMQQWCRNTNKMSSIKGLVLHSFPILKHAYKCGFTVKILQDFIEMENFSEAPIIIVYNPSERAVLLLHKAESKKIATDITLAVNYLKLFILLFHDALTNSHMKLMPLVLTDEKVNLDNLDCHWCMKYMLLSEKEFTNFDKIWQQCSFETECKEEINETYSKKFSAALLGFFAATLVYPNYIPAFIDEQNDHQQIQQLEVLLTPEQMDIYYSQDKHMIIKGGFGCGKSIIAAAMLQKISDSLENNEKLFFICYDTKSELLNMLKNNQEKHNEKLISFHNKEGHKLSKIIEHITKPEWSERMNLIVDEFDGEDLDKPEAKRLNDIFDKRLKEKFVILFAQEIEKERVINNPIKNRFDLLETMETHDLKSIMRNSEDIIALLEATKEVLREEKTVFTQPKGIKTSNQFDTTEEYVSPHESMSTQEDDQELEFDCSKPKFISVNKMGLGEAQTIIGTPMVDDTDGKITRSNFAYALVEETKHNMKSKRPVLFELGNQDEFHKSLSLAAILKRTLAISNKHVVLHFNTETNMIPSSLRFVSEHHFNKEIEITTSYKDFQSSDKCILICSFRTLRCVECPGITVLIDCDIYSLRHYLLETLSRCISKLYVIILQDSSFLTKMTEQWKTKKLVDQWETSIFQKDTESRDYSISNDENQKIINVTFKSQYYKMLEKKFMLLSSKEEIIPSSVKCGAKEISYQER